MAKIARPKPPLFKLKSLKVRKAKKIKMFGFWNYKAKKIK